MKINEVVDYFYGLDPSNYTEKNVMKVLQMAKSQDVKDYPNV